MRFHLFFPVLPLVVGLLAWAQFDAEAVLRVVILESLDADTASEVLPIFEAELDAQLAVDRRRVRFLRLHVSSSDLVPPLRRGRLADADLVVSFGSAAAASGSRALDGTATPHLFAYLPRELALLLTDAANAGGGAPTTGLTAQLPRGAAFAIANQLLASRNAPPLRIGIIHPSTSGQASSSTGPLAEAVVTPGFVAVPFTGSADDDAAVMVAQVTAAAAAAAASELAIDAFWLALDAAAPLAAMVQAIERHTGRPVVYAPSEAAVAAGALMSLAPEPRSTAREAASLAKQLLDGAAPLDVPVRAVRRVHFSLNLRTADTLGIVPSHELMELARGRLFR